MGGSGKSVDDMKEGGKIGSRLWLESLADVGFILIRVVRKEQKRVGVSILAANLNCQRKSTCSTVNATDESPSWFSALNHIKENRAHAGLQLPDEAMSENISCPRLLVKYVSAKLALKEVECQTIILHLVRMGGDMMEGSMIGTLPVSPSEAIIGDSLSMIVRSRE